MDASLTTVVRRFGINKGMLLEQPRSITVVEEAAAPGPHRNRGSLYILIELLGAVPDPDYVFNRLAEIIQEEYYRATGSVTGSISAALRAANDWLFDENLNSPREQRGVAGVTCAALREGELYLGQIGPALTYLLQADGLRRFPEDSPWLRQAIPSEAERTAAPPLGIRRVIEPSFYHATLRAGDTLVLASAGLARYVASRVVAEALEQGVDMGKRQLQLLANKRDISVLIVGLEDESTVHLLPQEDLLPAPEEDLLGEEEIAPDATAPRSLPLADIGRAAADNVAQTLQGMGEPLKRAGGSLVTLLKSTLPDRARSEPTVRKASAALSGPGKRLVPVLVALIPLLVLLLILVTRQQYERTRRAQFADLLSQASAARSEATGAGQKDAQRKALQQAVNLVDQALEIQPQDSTARSLRAQMLDELDRASDVQRLYTLWELADLSVAGVKPELACIVVRGQDVLVLDRSADRVYQRKLNPAGDALEVPAPNALFLQKGEPRGVITLGELVDMVWMDAGGERTTSDLLVLERNGSLIEWKEGRGGAVLPVADSAAWKKPLAIGAYYGNFYLLDVQRNRIIKYVPAANDYTNPPVDYLTEPSKVDLSGAVDMAIDGNIYVLLADGTIFKFLGGEPQPFQVTNLDEPFKSPVSLFVSGKDDTHGYLYVVDAGLARVVQLTKQGEFVRQFKAADGQTQLDQLRGLFVDEDSQRIYLTSGSKLYVAPLSPQSPAPTATPATG